MVCQQDNVWNLTVYLGRVLLIIALSGIFDIRITSDDMRNAIGQVCFNVLRELVVTPPKWAMCDLNFAAIEGSTPSK
jgi:hypothetical protein